MYIPNLNDDKNKFQQFLHSFYGYKKHFALVLMFLPTALYFIIFCYVPMYGITLAFKDFNPAVGIMRSEWVGLEHFQDMLTSRQFLRAFRNTIIISLLKMFVGFPLPIILALLLNEVRNMRFKKVIQTISYLPHFLSWVVLAGLFIQLLSPSSGAVNQLLGYFGVEPIFFLGDNRWFRTVLVVTDQWKGVGWGTIVYLAAISGLNPEMYEAADCDGATRFQKMFRITLPLIAPTISIIFILGVGNLLHAGFDQIFNLYNESVYKTADILDTYIYRVGLGKMNYETGTAAGLFKNGIGFVLVAITNAISKKLDGNGIW